MLCNNGLHGIFCFHFLTIVFIWEFLRIAFFGIYGLLHRACLVRQRETHTPACTRAKIGAEVSPDPMTAQTQNDNYND